MKHKHTRRQNKFEVVETARHSPPPFCDRIRMSNELGRRSFRRQNGYNFINTLKSKLHLPHQIIGGDFPCVFSSFFKISKPVRVIWSAALVRSTRARPSENSISILKLEPRVSTCWLIIINFMEKIRSLTLYNNSLVN